LAGGVIYIRVFEGFEIPTLTRPLPVPLQKTGGILYLCYSLSVAWQVRMTSVWGLLDWDSLGMDEVKTNVLLGGLAGATSARLAVRQW